MRWLWNSVQHSEHLVEIFVLNFLGGFKFFQRCLQLEEICVLENLFLLVDNMLALLFCRLYKNKNLQCHAIRIITNIMILVMNKLNMTFIFHGLQDIRHHNHHDDHRDIDRDDDPIKDQVVEGCSPSGAPSFAAPICSPGNIFVYFYQIILCICILFLWISFYLY